MKWLLSVEKSLAHVVKELPALSLHNKNALVRAWPWVALVFGVVQVLCLFSLWEAIQVAQRLRVAEYSVHEATQFTVAMAYVNMGVVLFMAIILLVAYVPLRMQQRWGWRLLFFVAVLNTLVAMIAFFTYGQGIGAALFSLIVSLLMFYLLFQVHDRYISVKAT